jgi:hypothetical protein
MSLLSRWLSSRRADLELLRRHGLRPVGGAASSHVQVAPDSTGKDVDADSIVSTESGTPTVYRQNVIWADPTTYAAKAAVINTAAAGTEYGGVTRPANPFPDRSTIAQSLVMSVNTTNNVALNTQGCGSFNIEITGTWTGTILVEGTVDGSTWHQVTGYNSVSGTSSSSYTANGTGQFTASGWAQVRLRCFSVGTGTAVVSLEASAGAGFTAFGSPPPQYYPADGGGASPGPTPLMQNLPLLYNGSTADRFRSNYNVTTGDTGTKTATFAGATQTNYNARGAIITILLGTVSGTSPTLAAQLQFSPDGGTTWTNLGAVLGNMTTSSWVGTIACYPGNAGVVGGNVTVNTGQPLPRTWRINYTIAGTSPSFAISSVNVSYVL